MIRYSLKWLHIVNVYATNCCWNSVVQCTLAQAGQSVFAGWLNCHPPPPYTTTFLAHLAWWIVDSGLSSWTWGEKKVCLCMGLAVETCTWNLSCGSVATTAGLCLWNGRFTMMVPAASTRRGFNQILCFRASCFIFKENYMNFFV